MSLSKSDGGCGLAVKAPDCGSGYRGFESRQPPCRPSPTQPDRCRQLPSPSGTYGQPRSRARNRTFRQRPTLTDRFRLLRWAIGGQSIRLWVGFRGRNSRGFRLSGHRPYTVVGGQDRPRFRSRPGFEAGLSGRPGRDREGIRQPGRCQTTSRGCRCSGSTGGRYEGKVIVGGWMLLFACEENEPWRIVRRQN